MIFISCLSWFFVFFWFLANYKKYSDWWLLMPIKGIMIIILSLYTYMYIYIHVHVMNRIASIYMRSSSFLVFSSAKFIWLLNVVNRWWISSLISLFAWLMSYLTSWQEETTLHQATRHWDNEINFTFMYMYVRGAHLCNSELIPSLWMGNEPRNCKL